MFLQAAPTNTSPAPPSPGPPDSAAVITLLLPSCHRERIDPLDYAPEQPPCQMALCKHPPVVPGVLDILPLRRRRRLQNY